MELDSFSTEPVVKERDLTKELTKDQRKEVGMNDAGVTDEKIFEVLSKGLEAKKTIKVVDEDGLVEFRDVEDWNVIHKFLDSALRVKGYIKAEASTDNSINFNLTLEQRDELKARIARLAKIIDVRQSP